MDKLSTYLFVPFCHEALIVTFLQLVDFLLDQPRLWVANKNENEVPKMENRTYFFCLLRASLIFLKFNKSLLGLKLTGYVA
jgi:hypothetical protein